MHIKAPPKNFSSHGKPRVCKRKKGLTVEELTTIFGLGNTKKINSVSAVQSLEEILVLEERPAKMRREEWVSGREWTLKEKVAFWFGSHDHPQSNQSVQTIARLLRCPFSAANQRLYDAKLKIKHGNKPHFTVSDISYIKGLSKVNFF